MSAMVLERAEFASGRSGLILHLGAGTNRLITIDGFHSRDLQSCGTHITKAMTAMLVHITKEVHYNSFVSVHQHGRRDVT